MKKHVHMHSKAEHVYSIPEKSLWHYVLWFLQLLADEINTVSLQDTQILLSDSGVILV